MGNPVDEGFEMRIGETGFFQEVCLFDQRVKSIECIEHTVDGFLSNHTNINEYFMCVFSDGYSIMIAHRLFGKARLHIFPEGCAALKLKDRISLVFNEVYGKDKLLRDFFYKYKIDLGLFSDTWVFDLGIDQGKFNAKKRLIEVRKIFEVENNIIERLNILYEYESKGNRDFFILDDVLVASDLLEGEAERKIYDVLFEFLNEKKVIVKPHPGQSVLLSEFRFQKYNVEFYENPDVPWEIILINLIKGKAENGIVIISPLLATSVMSTISFFSGFIPITIISLHMLEKKYFGAYIKKAVELNGDYYEKVAVNDSNVKLFIPENFKELKKCCESINGENKEREQYDELGEVSEYFFRVGNMISKATVFSLDGQFYVNSYFYFLQYNSEIHFHINKHIDIDEFVWRPSECNIFVAVSGVTVEIENDQGKREKYIVTDDLTNQFLDGGRIICKVKYRGYCKVLHIRGHFMVQHKYCALNWLYNDCKWRKRFWECWYEIEKNGLLEKFIKENTVENIWILGYGKIGQAINDGLKFNGVKTKFTASKTGKFKGEEISAVEQICKKEKLPDMMIITPMTDYDMIYFKLQKKLRSITVGLDEFISKVMK